MRGTLFVVGCRGVTIIDDLIAANRDRAGELAPGGDDARPRRRVAIVTCMDARLDVLAALGLDLGDAHVLRNAGGAVTDDVIRSLALSQRKLGTEAVMVVHHTGCGVQGLSDDAFREELRADTGMAPAFAIEGFADAEADVRQSVERVRRSPFLPHRDDVRGFVYDVATHRISEVDGAF
jgi:carbonic anhydrase